MSKNLEKGKKGSKWIVVKDADNKYTPITKGKKKVYTYVAQDRLPAGARDVQFFARAECLLKQLVIPTDYYLLLLLLLLYVHCTLLLVPEILSALDASGTASATKLAYISQSKRRCKVPSHLHPSTMAVRKQQSVMSRFVTTSEELGQKPKKRRRKIRMCMATTSEESKESNTNSSDNEERGKKTRRIDLDETANAMLDALVC